MIVYANGMLVLLVWLLIAVYLLINSRRIGYLKKLRCSNNKPLPEVAIIVPVRNEEENLANALTTLANLDYPSYKVIMVNDGSTDGSAAIMQAFANKYPHIFCYNIQSVPQGWIAKSHALHYGYRQSGAEWLLFTDADVRFKKESLQKAVQYCLRTNAAHVTILPQVRSRSVMVNCVNEVFQILMHLRYRPWATPNASSNAYMGMGAFNLVQRTAYEAIGTHARFALHPNDDLKLGECIKKEGYKQHVLYGQGELGYEWYSSLTDIINGLTKNAFSSVDYSLTKAVLSTLGAIVLFVLPVPLLLLLGSPLLQYVGLGVLCIQAVLLTLRKGAGGKWWYALLVPLAGLIIAFIMLRSALLTLYNNGVYWSKRFYALSELKKCR